MKFSFHIDDIEEVSSVWFEILNAKAYEKLVSRVKGIDNEKKALKRAFLNRERN